ncbi:unnamed protein product [Thlaspi arvense]|uniref:Mannosyl-oligosaccharide glucosidase n=1 Tax=Thlaspi arvense TaxID=13288 RepID=A0AAU9RDE6_THLAR|nr:unnamed protein product [Thlaspi arvense]
MAGATSMTSSKSLADQDGDNETLETFRTPSVITPFPGPKVMDLPMFQGTHKADLYWGTYRPQAYFGVRARTPKSLVAGLMWLVTRDGKPVVRHFCENKDKGGLKSFGWKEHNGIDFGRQDLLESELELTTSFVKSKVGNLGYGGDWSVRINVKNLWAEGDEEMKGANLFFYIADHEVPNNDLNLGLKGSTTLASGSRADVGNWQLHLRSKDKLDQHYCGFKTPNSVINLSELVVKNLNGGHALSNTVEPDSNVYVFQISTMNQIQTATIDIAFISGLEEETSDMEKRIDDLTDVPLSTILLEKEKAFDKKFKECYNLSGEVETNNLVVGKAAIANMLGGIGYFHGALKVSYKIFHQDHLYYFPTELYTAVPCRPKFPWGFLWDEGFHQMLIWRWDLHTSLEIVGHWLDLMNSEGWIPREQLLGAETLSKIRPEDPIIIQDPKIANPPTLLLVLCDLITKIHTKKFDANEASQIAEFLKGAFPRLEAWFHWLYTTQKGKIEGSFYWRGRQKTSGERNPRTLASGLDDYPRASDPSEDEMHVDLRCWIYLAADCMNFITEFLKEKPTEDYSKIAMQLSDISKLNKLHYDRDYETYLDFGNHTEKETVEKPTPRKVPHVGYVSLFPLISKIIPPKSQILDQQLTLILDEDKLWSHYGLLSLSKESSLYMIPNATDQTPYWRGPIWINLNYLILASLYHYSKEDGPYSIRARDTYTRLRKNLISNVVRNYEQTGYIWEHYNQTNGSGEGGRDFTGWSALILLIMSEDYPRRL